MAGSVGSFRRPTAFECFTGQASPVPLLNPLFISFVAIATMQPSPQSIQTHAQLNQQSFSEQQTFAYTQLAVTLEVSVARRSYSYHYFNVVKQRDCLLSFFLNPKTTSE